MEATYIQTFLYLSSRTSVLRANFTSDVLDVFCTVSSTKGGLNSVVAFTFLFSVSLAIIVSFVGKVVPIFSPKSLLALKFSIVNFSIFLFSTSWFFKFFSLSIEGVEIESE